MGNGFLLIVAGLLLFYLVISDKFKCIEAFAGCVTGINNAGAAPVSLPNLPQIPKAPTTTISYGYPNLSLNSNWIYNNGI